MIAKQVRRLADMSRDGEAAQAQIARHIRHAAIADHRPCAIVGLMP
ncbi:hypothetical protein V474_04180 [Novosphingobium barchaimii LL02]|uniref:Uncharacterized protein n=3 Tax=Sphingomonadaceae TaxID=41297 RepID=A0A0J7XIG4_9SPHN|nr:hypothetical protein L288_20980 [Sphingobium quisquiliarum P25]EQB34250.1 hypothetical protein M529_00090 [Sphingobium ummariense RL-3]KMS51439.1 hypothetical protein V474_04180 [Novosphingobium barchaimii LL02]